MAKYLVNSSKFFKAHSLSSSKQLISFLSHGLLQHPRNPAWNCSQEFCDLIFTNWLLTHTHTHTATKLLLFLLYPPNTYRMPWFLPTPKRNIFRVSISVENISPSFWRHNSTRREVLHGPYLNPFHLYSHQNLISLPNEKRMTSALDYLVKERLVKIFPYNPSFRLTVTETLPSKGPLTCPFLSISSLSPAGTVTVSWPSSLPLHLARISSQQPQWTWWVQ